HRVDRMLARIFVAGFLADGGVRASASGHTTIGFLPPGHETRDHEPFYGACRVRRYSPGVIPYQRLNARMNAVGSAYPSWNATPFTFVCGSSIHAGASDFRASSSSMLNEVDDSPSLRWSRRGVIRTSRQTAARSGLVPLLRCRSRMLERRDTKP